MSAFINSWWEPCKLVCSKQITLPQCTMQVYTFIPVGLLSKPCFFPAAAFITCCQLLSNSPCSPQYCYRSSQYDGRHCTAGSSAHTLQNKTENSLGWHSVYYYGTIENVVNSTALALQYFHRPFHWDRAFRIKIIVGFQLPTDPPRLNLNYCIAPT